MDPLATLVDFSQMLVYSGHDQLKEKINRIVNKPLRKQIQHLAVRWNVSPDVVDVVACKEKTTLKSPQLKTFTIVFTIEQWKRGGYSTKTTKC